MNLKSLNYANKSWIFGSGSLDTVSKLINNDNRLLSYGDKKQGFGFSIIKESELIEYTKEPKGFICEVLSEKLYPKKVYFDIDKHKEEDKLYSLSEIKNIIKTYFGDVKMAISGNENKGSYHIVLPELIIRDYAHMEELRKYVEKINKNICSAFDYKIYTRNRLMKCINQFKNDINTTQKILEDYNPQHHFITSFLTGNEKELVILDNEDLPTDEIEVCDLNNNPVLLPNEFNLEDIAEVKKLYDLLLNLKLVNYSHSFTWKVAIFLNKLGLTFDDFWNWTKYKDSSIERKNKWIAHWNTINTYENKCTISGFIRLLSIWYYELVGVDCKYNLYTNKFIQSFNINSIKISKIEKHHYDVNNKVIIMNTAMGSGKTTTTINYLKDSNKTFCWITPRITLACNTHERLKLVGLDSALYKDCKTKIVLNKNDNLVVQTESLFKINDIKNYDIIIIDEIETVLNAFDSTTHDKHIDETFYNFKRLLQNSNKIILLDAFTTSHTIQFLNSLDINDIITYSSDYKPEPKTLVENQDYIQTLNKMCADLDEGKKIYAFYAYKSGNETNHYSIEHIQIYLLTNCKTRPRIKVYHGDITDKEKRQLGNVNEVWSNYDCVLTTSAITVGVNYEKDDFDKVYLLVSGLVNNVRDVIQSSMRVRRTKEKIIEVYFFNKSNKIDFKYPAYYKKKTDIIYNKLVDNIKIEKQSEFFPVFLYFCNLTNYDASNLVGNIPIRKKDFVNQFFESKMLVSYNKCKKIYDNDAIKIERKIIDCMATQDEKFSMQRYYFDKKFRLLDEVDRCFIWNNRAQGYFLGIENELFLQILNENNANYITQLNFNNLQCSENLLKDINDYMSSTVSNKNQLITRVINNIMNMSVITVKRIKKNLYYKLDNIIETLVEIQTKLKLLQEEENNNKINEVDIFDLVLNE